MKKGCIIGLAIFVVLIIAVGVFLNLVVTPKIYKGIAAAEVLALETAIEEYTKAFGETPEGDHAAIIKTLQGENPTERDFLGDELEGPTATGEFLDPWDHALVIQPITGGGLRVFSVGPNGTAGDADDVASKGLRRLVKKLEKKAANMSGTGSGGNADKAPEPDADPDPDAESRKKANAVPDAL